MTDKKKALLAASFAGIIAATGASFAGNAEAAEAGKVHCYGINKCAGTGDCGGKGHGCAGQNKCKGAAWISLDKEDCLRIEGGRLTAEPKE